MAVSDANVTTDSNLEHLAELRRRRDAFFAPNPAAEERAHERGLLTANERINLLLDPGSEWAFSYGIGPSPLRLGFGEIHGQRREPAKRTRPAGKQVDRRWWRRLTLRQQINKCHDAPDRVVEVGEIEGVGLSFYSEVAPPHGGSGERRDDAVRMVAGTPVNVGKPDDRGPYPFAPGRFHEPFTLDLGAPIDVDGAQRSVFGYREAAGLSVDFAAAGEDEPWPPRRLAPSRLDDGVQPADIGVPAAFRIVFPPHDAGHRGEMDDAVATSNGGTDTPRISHVAIFATRSPEVQSDNIYAARFKRHAQSATNQPFRTCNQYPTVHAPPVPDDRFGFRQTNFIENQTFVYTKDRRNPIPETSRAVANQRT